MVQEESLSHGRADAILLWIRQALQSDLPRQAGAASASAGDSRLTNLQAATPSEPPLPVEIRFVKVADLGTFAREALASLRPGEVVPISPSRATAQSHNPNAKPDDVGLLVAYRDGRCVGTLGLVPGLLRAVDRIEPVDWLSAWYVAPEYRNTGAGERLLIAALSLRRNLAASKYSEEAGRMYKAMRFKTLGPLSYLLGDVSRYAVLGLPFKAAGKVLARAGAGWATPFERAARGVAAWPSKAVIYARMAAATAALGPPIEARPIDRIGVEAAALRAERDRCAPVRFERDPSVMNWMLADRWVVKHPRDAAPGYYFRDCDPRFGFEALEIAERGTGRLLGFVIFRTGTARGARVLSIVDHHSHDPADLGWLLPLAVRKARSFGADFMLLPLQCQAAVEASRPVRRYFRVENRPYCIRLAQRNEALDRDLDRITLDVADGQVGFA
jgi:GNAT superfamily N-acetyltransferase